MLKPILNAPRRSRKQVLNSPFGRRKFLAYLGVAAATTAYTVSRFGPIENQPSWRRFPGPHELTLSLEEAEKQFDRFPANIKAGLTLEKRPYPAAGVTVKVDLKYLARAQGLEAHKTFQGGVFEEDRVEQFTDVFDHKQAKLIITSHVSNQNDKDVHVFLFSSGSNASSLIESKAYVETVKQAKEKNLNFVVLTYGNPGQDTYGLMFNDDGKLVAPSLAQCGDNPSEKWQETAEKFFTEKLLNQEWLTKLGFQRGSKIEFHFAAQSAAAVPLMRATIKRLTIPGQGLTSVKIGNVVLLSPLIEIEESLSKWSFANHHIFRNQDAQLFPHKGWYLEPFYGIRDSFEARYGQPLPPELVLRATTGLGAQIYSSIRQLENTRESHKAFLDELGAGRLKDLFQKGLTIFMARGGKTEGGDNVVSNAWILNLIRKLEKTGLKVDIHERTDVPHNHFLKCDPAEIADALTKGLTSLNT